MVSLLLTLNRFDLMFLGVFIVDFGKVIADLIIGKRNEICNEGVV